MEQNSQSPKDEKLGVGLWILSMLFPIVGAILYFVWKSEKPTKSKGACQAALVGLGIGIVINILVRLL